MQTNFRVQTARALPAFVLYSLAGLALAQPQPQPAAPDDALGGTWSTFSHICPGGNRTDALHRDPNGTLWVGCGTAAEGYGLFRSADGGASWQAAVVSPANRLDQFRVSSISRGHDGALYVAGDNSAPSNLEMVVRVDTASTPYAVTPTLVGINQNGRVFHVGTYRELADGRAIAEALNGTNVLYRPLPTTGTSAGSWVRDLGTVQILDMVAANDAFYGAGSRIVEPPRVFLPPRTPGNAPWQFETVELQPANGWEGELWGIAVNARRVVAVGIDQDSNVGKIFVSSGDPYLAANYAEFSISALTGDTITWGRGACMRGNRIVVVGERQPLSSATGRVLISDNGGVSFSVITPAGVSGTVSKCVIEPDGTVVVTGSGGFVGVRQDPDWIFVNEFERD